MVSTRQMATIGNVNSHNNAAENVTPPGPIPSPPSSSSSTSATASSITNILRPSFVTRQNCSGNNNNNNIDYIVSNSDNDDDNDIGDNGDDCSSGNTDYLIIYTEPIVPESNTKITSQEIEQITNVPIEFITDVVCLRSPPTPGVLENNTNLLDLPEEILNTIFSYLDYKNIAQMRLVSHKMNDICMHMLNSTFFKLINTTYNRFQAIKANMPRRESARRKHPLACECDIIETCYMRLSLLQMTFGKHIERGHCCFFPGMILDEVYNILNHIKTAPNLERPFRLTDELFDLSTMAMEYFRDYIEPTLPGIIAYFNKDFFTRPTSSIRPTLVISAEMEDTSDALPSPPQSNMVLRKGIRKIKQGMKMYNNQLSVLRNELRSCKRKGTEQTKQIGEQQNLIEEQRKQILELANRLDENDKKNEEMSRKFSTLLQELNKCKTELQYGRSKSPATSNCTSCGQRISSSNVFTEDYQAFISHVHKMENRSPIVINENNCNSSKSLRDPTINDAEFVFPDESTTAKLLSVNSAAKRLKRSNSTDNAVDAELKQNWNENQPSTSSAAACGQSKSAIIPMQSPKNNDNNNTNNTNTNICNGNDNNINNNNNSHYIGTVLECSNSTSPDTKKARRVQKASRSINASGTKRKNYIN